MTPEKIPTRLKSFSLFPPLHFSQRITRFYKNIYLKTENKVKITYTNKSKRYIIINIKINRSKQTK